MQSPVQYSHEVVTDNFEMLIARKIVFTTWQGTTVHVNLKKDVTIRANKMGRLEAKTYSYRYHANLPNGVALVRYCSPDDPKVIQNPNDHHTFHHKHVFDHLGAQTQVLNMINAEGGWPHVGDFLNEVLSTF